MKTLVYQLPKTILFFLISNLFHSTLLAQEQNLTEEVLAIQLITLEIQIHFHLLFSIPKYTPTTNFKVMILKKHLRNSKKLH